MTGFGKPVAVNSSKAELPSLASTFVWEAVTLGASGSRGRPPKTNIRVVF